MRWRSAFGWFRVYGGLDEAAEQFLAGSSDLAELERRLRALERGHIRVISVTFNH